MGLAPCTNLSCPPSDILELMSERQMSDVGGTPGGLGHFLIGFAMACIGGYLLSNQVMVVGSYWSFFGANSFGITLLPMLLGVAMLFWNGRSVLGWVLTAAGGLFIVAGVIANMHIYFQPATLFHTTGAMPLHLTIWRPAEVWHHLGALRILR